MRQKLDELDQRVLIAGAAVGLLLFALLGYLVLISPQRSKASKLAAQISETQASIDQNRTLRASRVEKVHVADLFRLSKAMPDQTNMPDLLLQLSRTARDSGIQFDSVTPGAAAPSTGYTTVPIQLVFQGNFYELSDFLLRLRNLLDVQDGRLDSAGRLFTVDGVQFAEGEKSFPQLKATLTVDAFVFGAAAATSTAPAATTATTTATTTTTTTTTTPTTTQPSNSAAALGAIP